MQTRSELGSTFTIHIHDTDHSGDITDLKLSPPGFAIDWNAGETIFEPLIPSTCTIPIWIQSSAEENLMTDLTSADEGRFRIVIRTGLTDAGPIYWIGKVTQDQIEFPDEPYPYLFTIKAVDGLQLLSRIPYDNQGDADLISVLVYCLQQCGTDDLFVTAGSDVTFIKALTDIAPNVGTYGDVLTDVKLRPGKYDPATQEYRFDMSVEDVLSQIARCMNARVFLGGGSFWFMSQTQYLTTPANVNARRFKSDSTELSTSNEILIQTITGGATGERLASWRSQFLPPIKQITRPLTYGDGTLVSNLDVPAPVIHPIQSSVGTNYVSYTLSTDNEFPAGTVFNISGTVDLTAEYLTLTGDDRCGRLRFVMELRIGTQYLTREGYDATSETTSIQADLFNTSPLVDSEMFIWDDPDPVGWTTNTAARVQWGSDVLNYNLASPYLSGPDDTQQMSINITTPPLPGIEDVDVELRFNAYLFDGDGTAAGTNKANVTTAEPSFTIAVGDGLQGASVLFEAANANEATERRIESEINFGSQLVQTGEYYYNPAEFYNVNGGLPTWTSTHTTTPAGIHEVAVSDQARYFAVTREIFSGAIYRTALDLHPGKIIYILSKSTFYIVGSMSLLADRAEYELELHELGIGSTAPTVSVNNLTPKRPTINLQDGDQIRRELNRGIRNNVADVSALNTSVDEVRAQSGASGGESVIQLQYLGDVKISGPTNGQILEYNSTAQRWANVTPSTGSTVASLDDVGDVNVPSPTDGQLIQWNATAGEWQAVNPMNLANANQTIGAGVTRDIVLDGSASNLTYYRIVDANGDPMFMITNYGTILNIVEYFGVIAYRSTATVKGSFALYEAAANGTNFLQFTAPDNLSGSRFFTFPGEYGTSGQFLQTNGAGVLSWASASGGGSSVSYMTVQSAFFSSDGNGDYIPIGGTLAETTSSQYYNRWTAPLSGEVVSARIFCTSSTAGSTTLSISKYNIPSSIDSDTQTISSANVDVEFTFTTATFVAGDQLRFWFDPTGTPSGVSVTLLIKLNHP